MKIYSGVFLYGGCISEMTAFTDYGKAHDWFRTITEASGGESACEAGDYIIEGNGMRFFNSLGGGDTEVYVERIDLDEGVSPS